MTVPESAATQIATFRCDASLCLGEIDGQMADRLWCDAGELLGPGWQAFLRNPSQAVLAELEADKRAGRGGRYDLPFRSRRGDRLYVAVRTFALHSAGGITMAGTVTLLHWQPSRRIIDLGA